MASKTSLKRPHAIGRALNFATAATNALCNARLEPHDLTLPQWVILGALWQQGEVSVTELAAYTGNAGPATSRILDRMEQKGLLGRRQDPKDRRSARVFLLPGGEALRHLQSFYQDINDTLLTGLSAQEAEQLFTLLDKVTQNAQAGKTTAP